MQYSQRMILGILVTALLIGLTWTLNRKPDPETDASLNTSLSTQESSDLTSDPATSATIVEFDGAKFTPSQVTVTPNTPVTFRNLSDSPLWAASDPHPGHSAYSEFDAKDTIGKGESYTFTFDQPGNWTYHNHVAPSQRGTVTVK